MAIHSLEGIAYERSPRNYVTPHCEMNDLKAKYDINKLNLALGAKKDLRGAFEKRQQEIAVETRPIRQYDIATSEFGKFFIYVDVSGQIVGFVAGKHYPSEEGLYVELKEAVESKFGSPTKEIQRGSSVTSLLLYGSSDLGGLTWFDSLNSRNVINERYQSLNIAVSQNDIYYYAADYADDKSNKVNAKSKCIELYDQLISQTLAKYDAKPKAKVEL